MRGDSVVENSRFALPTAQHNPAAMPAPLPVRRKCFGLHLDHLLRAAAHEDIIRLLLEAFTLACKERDAQILIAVKAQAAAGDPSPANTVAAERGMRPPAVRQAAKRTRDRVLQLAATNARFAPLADLPLLAP